MKFLFNRDKGIDISLLIEDETAFTTTLTELHEILSKSNNSPQANLVGISLEKLRNKNYSSFVEDINSVNFWGGSGAVWEVYIENQLLSKEFSKQMIQLIELMDKNKMLLRKINSIKKLFKDNL